MKSVFLDLYIYSDRRICARNVMGSSYIQIEIFYMSFASFYTFFLNTFAVLLHYHQTRLVCKAWNDVQVYQMKTKSMINIMKNSTSCRHVCTVDWGFSSSPITLNIAACLVSQSVRRGYHISAHQYILFNNYILLPFLPPESCRARLRHTALFQSPLKVSAMNLIRCETSGCW